MSKYVLELTGRDWRRASPGDPNACLLAVGLGRQLGGQWSVAGRHATRFAKDGETIETQLTLGADAKSVMRWFDWLGLKTGSKVTLYGNVKQPKPKGKGARRGRDGHFNCVLERPARGKHHAPLSMGQKGAVTTAAGGGILVVTGLWWVDAIAAGIAALGMGGTIAVRRGWISVPRPSPRPARPAAPELPSFRTLRGMAPRERTAEYRRAVGAPEPATAAPEPITEPSAPVAAPAPPRPRWPVPAPREVEGVSHKSAIPDHVPDHLVQREQARATERG